MTTPLRRPLRRTTTKPLGVVAGLGLCVGVLVPAAPAAASSFRSAPGISTVSPGTGAAGTKVTITGSGLTGATAVRFSGVASVFTVMSSSKITATVPAMPSADGPVTVTTPAGMAKSTERFAVVPAVLLSAGTGPPGSAVGVSGTGFGALEGVDVFVDSTDEALAGAGADGSFGPVTVRVPGSAIPGADWVSAEGRHSGLFAQAAFTVNTNWAQFRYSGKHKGSNPFENVLSAANVAQIDQDWAFPTSGGISSPAVVDSVVYVGATDNNVYALNAATGTKLWSFATSGSVESSPDVANGVVYVGSDDGNVYALNAANGAKLWSFPTGTPVHPSSVLSSPVVVSGVVYVGATNDNVYALNAASGAELWSFTTTQTIFSSPAVANGVVYFGSGDGKLYALRAATGAELWSFTTSGVGSSPTVANGVVYFGSSDDNVYALNAATGIELWSFTTGGGVDSSPAVANGDVYVGSANGSVYALNARTGAEMWSFTTGALVFSSPAVANGVVYVGSDDSNVYALSAGTGAELWSYTTGFSVESSPAVANGAVYVGSDDGNLYAFDLAGGLARPARPSRTSLRPDYSLRMWRWAPRRITLRRTAQIESGRSQSP